MPPSSNWLALKKDLKGGAPVRHENARRKRKLEALYDGEGTSEGSIVAVEPEKMSAPSRSQDASENRDSVASLRNMVYGHLTYPPAHQLPGKYLAIDCEMVGIAGDPSKASLEDRRDESSLARVSIVNYYGAVQLDVFVRQRERVTDWRTAVSGVRQSDMADAKSFSEVQRLVADLLKNRILVGHAVHNDLKALLLSHPHSITRDTQVLSRRHGTLVTSKPRVAASASDAGTAAVKVRLPRNPALRKLVRQDLGIEIQAGEHSSVTDARATMAIYRLHRKTWDRCFLRPARTAGRKTSQTAVDGPATDHAPQPAIDLKKSAKTRKRGQSCVGPLSEDDAEDLPDRPASSTAAEARHQGKRRRAVHLPVKRQGISSGLSVVVKKRRRGSTEERHIIRGTRGTKKSSGSDKWWGTLANPSH